jgi:HEAT repeat protein
MAEGKVGQTGTDRPTTARRRIERLMADLASKDGLKRVRARKTLVFIGEPAVSYLVKALKDKQEWMRWEAAKTLSQIGSPAATQALIAALEDKMFDVRWLSAEGLIAIGRDALVPLLHALVDHAESSWLREGVHHVLHGIEDREFEAIIAPVISSLEGTTPIEAPLAAEKALNKLGHGGAHGRTA